MFFNTVQNYVKTLILSTGLKNFTEMAKLNRVSADTIQRKLYPADDSHQEMLKIAQDFFKKVPLYIWFAMKHFLIMLIQK